MSARGVEGEKGVEMDGDERKNEGEVKINRE